MPCERKRRTPRDGAGQRPLHLERLEPRALLSTYYVDPAGLGGAPSDANPGTITRPLADLPAAVAKAQPGDTIFLRGGTYDLANFPQPILNSGAPGAPLTICNYPGEQPVIDLGEYYPQGANGWQQDASGNWYVNLPANSIAAAYSNVSVQIVNGLAASPIPGAPDPVTGGPPAAFTDPAPGFYTNGKLAYNLTWYNPATSQLWFKSNQIQAITDPATQCAVVSSANQFNIEGSWIVIDGLRIQDGMFGIHVESGTNVVVENCRVTNCAGQGILFVEPDGEVADNYVDEIGGEVYLYSNGIVYPEGLYHDLYAGGSGTVIHDNFFGRAASGSSAQLVGFGIYVGAPFTANLLFYNNVCYGADATAVTVEGGNVTVTGNVLIANGQVANEPGGAYLFFPEPDVIFSGNYVEGTYDGLTIWNSGDTPVPGVAITHNTIAGGVLDATFDDGLPGVMNGNQWGGGLAVFSVLGQSYNYAGFLAWANANGFEEQSAGTVTPLIDGSTYDEQLDADPTLAQVMSLFRTYATAQINSYPPSAAGATASEIDGTTTLGADGTAPQAADPTYDFSVGTPLNVAAAQGLLAGSSDADGEPLVAALAANPAHGAVTVNANGSFVYTPSPGYAGADSFVYEVSNGNGGTALATVTLSDAPTPTGGFDVRAVEGSASGAQTVATFACPHAVAADFTATVTWGDGHISAGTIAANSSGGFTVSGSNTYAAEGSYTVGVTITDVADGATQSTTSTASVADAPLTIRVAAISAGEGTVFNGVVATFTDTGGAEPPGDYTATIKWGDGTTSPGTVSPASGNSLNVSGSHTYLSAGTDTVTVTVVDDGNTSTPGSTVSGSSTATVARIMPRVTNVVVGSDAWSGSFLSYLAAQNPNNAGGYSIPVGSGAQLLPLPWTNIDEIKVTFNENVTVAQADMMLVGVNTHRYNVAGGTFSYNAATFTATWTLPAAIPDDKLLLELNAAGGDPIENASDNRLEGEWTNPTTTSSTGTSQYPSGDGVSGNFLFRFNVLPGNVSQDGNVEAVDGLLVSGALGSSAGEGNYSIFKDVNGDGYVLSNDQLLVLGQVGKSLPAANPVAAAFPAAAENSTVRPSASPALRPLAALDVALLSVTEQLENGGLPTSLLDSPAVSSPGLSAPAAIGPALGQTNQGDRT